MSRRPRMPGRNAGWAISAGSLSIRPTASRPTTPMSASPAGSAGNLSTTQTTVGLLREGVPTGNDETLLRTISEPTSMFRAAQLVGEALHVANDTVGKALASIKISASSSMLLGGRIGDSKP